MRILSGFRSAASLAAVALLVTASWAQTVDDKPAVKTEIIDKVTDLLSTQAYVPGLDFAKWKEFAEAQKAQIEGSKNDDEFNFAVNSAFRKFGASHIVLISPQATSARKSGSMVGIGVTSQRTEEGTLIVRTVAGAAADKAGIVPGDIIVKVDGQKADWTKGIAGAEGTTLIVTVKHADGSVADYTLTRTKFDARRHEELVPVDGDTARLAVYSFDVGSYDRMNVENLMQKASKYKNLILDLRDNPGGAVVNMRHLLGMLVPSTQPVGTYVDRPLVDAYVEATGGTPSDVVKAADWSRGQETLRSRQLRPLKNRLVPAYGGHVAVLINAFSGSASEMCAAALRDTAGVQIVGTKSAGAVLVSVIDDATNGFTLQYPIMDYVTVKGLRIEGKGVEPTVKVEESRFRIANAKDPVVDRATAILEAPVLSAARG